MAKTTPLLLLLSGMLTAAGARADFYSCKDGTGHLVTSDRPIPECADRSTQIYKDNGTLKSQLSGAMTEEQKKAAEMQQQQRARQVQHQEDIRREQLFLTAHYPDEKAIETARRQALSAIETRIGTETGNIATATATLNQNQKLLPGLPKSQQSKIQDARSKIEDMTQAISESNRLITAFRNEEIKVNQQYDAIHKRYAEIIPAGTH